MTRAARILGLTLTASLLARYANADTLAQYDPMGGNPNPDTQGWTWTGTGTLGGGGGTLLMIGRGGAENPNNYFTETVPTNAFNEAWTMEGTFRLAGNSFPEMGAVIFADDGANFWHLSFLNTGNDSVDGIWNGGDFATPFGGHSKVWEEPVPAKPFDGFFKYGIVDADGKGGNPPQLYFEGAPLSPAVALSPTPSKFPAGTVGFGLMRVGEAGFLQVNGIRFDGNPNAVPEPATLLLAGIALCGLARLSRHARGQ